jgi:hypothetical protein
MYSSALAREYVLWKSHPPVRRTSPLDSRVALWRYLAVTRDPLSVKWPVVGS